MDITDRLLEQFKDSPEIALLLSCIVYLIRENKSLKKDNKELQNLMRSLNDKIRDDIVPLLTRLLDLVPDLLEQVRRRK